MKTERSKELNDLLEKKQNFPQRWAEAIILFIVGLLGVLGLFLQIRYSIFK
jgi:hypothetical protein